MGFSMAMNNKYSFVRKQNAQSNINLEVHSSGEKKKKPVLRVAKYKKNHSNLFQSIYCKENSLDVLIFLLLDTLLIL